MGPGAAFAESRVRGHREGRGTAVNGRNSAWERSGAGARGMSHSRAIHWGGAGTGTGQACFILWLALVPKAVPGTWRPLVSPSRGGPGSRCGVAAARARAVRVLLCPERAVRVPQLPQDTLPGRWPRCPVSRPAPARRRSRHVPRTRLLRARALSSNPCQKRNRELLPLKK
ncbi:hypothetical protein Nmel_016814 [Mimus melanotis]